MGVELLARAALDQILNIRSRLADFPSVCGAFCAKELAEQGFHPEQLTAAIAVWGFDNADWRVDYWHSLPQHAYPIDYPLPDSREYRSALTVYVGKQGQLRHEVRQAIPAELPPPNKYIEHAKEVLRQRGYDPQQYQPRLWYFGRWHVDYWRKGVASPDFLTPPALVVHLADPTMSRMKEDELEIPIDPRVAKRKKK